MKKIETIRYNVVGIARTSSARKAYNEYTLAQGFKTKEDADSTMALISTPKRKILYESIKVKAVKQYHSPGSLYDDLPPQILVP